ncbi:MAG: hypothetical protein U9R66_07555 [Thermodesulfobacteriota bacterium]|nr:hypothetical protein [Thermodesulfobacteriota bacterium]
MVKNKKQDKAEPKQLQTLTLKMNDDLYRAFQRCTWILIHESGRTQLEVINEMVEDFLVKHGC